MNTDKDRLEKLASKDFKESTELYQVVDFLNKNLKYKRGAPGYSVASVFLVTLLCVAIYLQISSFLIPNFSNENLIALLSSSTFSNFITSSRDNNPLLANELNSAI